MSEAPPDRDLPDDVDERYRRAAARDPTRPSESVRRAVLAHAERLAAERRLGAATGVRRTAGSVPRPAWWRPALFGTLATAALAALVIAPRLLTPHTHVETRMTAPAAPGVSAVAPTPSAPPASADLAAAPAASTAAVASPAPQSPPPQAPAGEAGTARLRGGAQSAQAARAAGTSERFNAAAAPPTRDAAADARGEPAAGVTGSLAARRATAPAVNAFLGGAGTTALQRAAETGDLATLATLLAKPTDIDGRDESGRTPLMLAVLHGQTEAVAMLLAHGADPDARDSQGTTPLQAAQAGNSAAIVQQLQRYGAR